jgi:hypothetical protein
MCARAQPQVLLDAAGQLQVSDMGLCVDISRGPVCAASDPLGPSIRHGTCGYWPPEVIREQEYTTEPDWWALGVTAFQLFCDRLPFFGENDNEKNERILQSESILPTRFTHCEPPLFVELINALLTVDTTRRLGCARGVVELRAHPFFGEFDFARLEAGAMDAPILPNVNDINAPSKKEIDGFVQPDDVVWEADDQAKLGSWDYVAADLHGAEAVCRIKKRKELHAALTDDGLDTTVLSIGEKRGGGGGGCCELM